MLTKQISFAFILLGALSLSVNAQVIPKKGSAPQRVYGLTIEELDKLDVGKFADKFKDVSVPVTLRIVFQANTLPSEYEAKLAQLHNPKPGKKKFNIVGLPFDATALRVYQLAANPDEKFNCGTFQATDPIYDHRAKCFVEYFSGARDYVDAWEVGNEVNGEWADEDFEKALPPGTKPGKPDRTIEKIRRLINFIPVNKPLMLTVSYMPGCLDWPDNAMDRWIENFTKYMSGETIARIDYVLISYYENNCDFHVLNERDPNEVNEAVFKPLRTIFRDQFVGMGEIGYSDGPDEKFETCRDNSVCYCDKGSPPTIRKSKISQMQRYYGLKPADPLYIGGGFWWNAGKDYKVGDFLKALKKQFSCLATSRQCEIPLPINCR